MWCHFEPNGRHEVAGTTARVQVLLADGELRKGANHIFAGVADEVHRDTRFDRDERLREYVITQCIKPSGILQFM